MTTEAFDRIIRKLAEGELPHDYCSGTGFLPGNVRAGLPTEPCRGCNGTSRIVPFASLRVKCHHSEFSHKNVTVRCPHWRPEPDVEKACWRVGKVLQRLPEGALYWIAVARLKAAEKDVMWEMEECWLRAAEAWLDEKRKEA